MGEEPTRLTEVSEATRLEYEIQRERAELAENIQAIEARASRAANWRYQFAQRPAAGAGLAFVAGLAAARMMAGGNHNQRHGGGLTGLRAALLGIITAEAREYLRSRWQRGNAEAG
jgi:hypothetical protein